MDNVAYTITGDGVISLSLNNSSYIIGKDHLNYQEIMDCLSGEEYSAISGLVNVVDTIAAKAKGEITFEDGVICWNGTPLENALTEKVIEFYRQGMPYKPLFNMIRNLWLNPSKNSREQVYRFLETNQLPVTPDGCILFYKRVTNDYKDTYTRKIDNSVGALVNMKRLDVVEDPNRTCESGLHVCSLGYLKGFHSGSKIVICKVDPANIVSVPIDYENTKVRVCEYLVVGEWDSDEVDMFDGDAVRNSDCTEFNPDDDPDYDYDDEDYGDDYSDDVNSIMYGDNESDSGNVGDGITDVFFEYGEKPNGDRFYNIRDNSGRFVKQGDVDAPEYGVKPNGDSFYNVRDNNGRFVKGN